MRYALLADGSIIDIECYRNITIWLIVNELFEFILLLRAQRDLSSGGGHNDMKKVLFVCIENSCRSQMAEAFAKIHGRGIVDAYSSGSNPSGKVNEKAVAAMEETGYDLSAHMSKSLSEIPDIEYDYVITMGCGDRCPFVKARQREDWKVPDPKDMDEEQFRKVRDMIEGEVKKLLTNIR